MTLFYGYLVAIGGKSGLGGKMNVNIQQKFTLEKGVSYEGHEAIEG